MARWRIKAWAKGLALAAGLAMGGCTALSGPARVESAGGAAPRTFPGLIAPVSGAKRRYIFQIHGINATSDAWAQELFAALSARGYDRVGGYGDRCAMLAEPMTASVRGLGDQASAGVCRSPADATRTLVNGCSRKTESCAFDHFGLYRKDVYENRQSHRQVIVFTYRWRDDIWLINHQFIGDDLAENSLPWWKFTPRRSKLNAFLKTMVMDNGISDAAGYVGPLRDLARQGVESALCAMYQDALDAAVTPPQGGGCLRTLEGQPLDGRSVEFNFLSHSLGSRMLYDVLSDETAPPQTSARVQVANQTRTFFMAANQLPLLATVGLSIVPATPGAPPPPRRTFFELRQAGAAGALALGERRPSPVTETLTIVAFQDPDDLLGYRGSDAVLADPEHGVTFVDILHRNAPQILFLVDWIGDAHDHEMIEPNSQQIIMCGGAIGEGGGVTASRC